MIIIKKIISVILIFTLICALFSMKSAALSKVGSRGDEVKSVQNRLIQLGYYYDKADGIFGSKTKSAVMNFQRDYGLTVDGIVGPKTLSALKISSSGNSWQDKDCELLARLISAEARGEPYIGQVAVGAVVLNRVEHPSFPNSVSGVIYEHGAFSCLYDGQFYEPVSSQAYSAARDALNGMDPSGGAIYYYNPKKSTNQWIRTRPVVASFGEHIFCM